MERILVVSATEFEILPFMKYLNDNFQKKSFFVYGDDNLQISTLVTGVGALLTAFGMSRLTKISENTLIINVGVAGAFDRSLALGEVVEVIKDRFGDLGVQENDGAFTDIYQLELMDKDKFPFKDGWLHVEPKSSLKPCSAITVNKVHGMDADISKIQQKYQASLETMEGAGFLYAAKSMDIDCMQIRAISNYVEPRNKDNWNLDLAIDNLNSALIQEINKFKR